MRSSTYRKYINSMRLKTADLPEYGYIGLHFMIRQDIDTARFKLAGQIINMAGGNARLVLIDPAYYKNRDALIAHLARAYSGMNPNTLKVYALPNIDTAVDLSSMAYQEMSSAYVYRMWMSSVKMCKTTPTFKEMLSTLYSDVKLAGWHRISIVTLHGVEGIPGVKGTTGFPALKSQDIRTIVGQNLLKYEADRCAAGTINQISQKILKEVAALPGEIKLSMSARTGRTDGRAASITVSKDTTPPTVHPIPDGFSVNKLTKEAFMSDLKTAPKIASPAPSHGRTDKHSAMERFMRSKRNMLKAIREHEDVVMAVKDLIIK